ncbi:hypothetical protein AX769_16050 [Frondihabitans sp. PAMC 28766]|nr:hypothetical protein AX769_16050 [Frondihabitans sp. PAMC 28766]
MTFDARDPGTGEKAWARDPRLGALPPATLDPRLGLLVLAAHPDDETLGAGGLISASVAAERPVTVCVVTDGRASHAADLIDADELAGVRLEELRRAMRALGGPALEVLGYADGSLRENRAAVQAELALVIDSRPESVVVAPWRGDGHRDHRVLGEIAAELAAERGLVLWEYPIWMWHWADSAHPDVPWGRMRAVHLSAADRLAKRIALDSYVSQTTPRGSEPPQLDEGFLPCFRRPFETFTVASEPPSVAVERP